VVIATQRNISHMQYQINRLRDKNLDHNCDMNVTNLSANLKQARKQAGLTQTELAKKAKVSQTTISDIERGRNQGSAELPRIALALGIAVEALTGIGHKLSTIQAGSVTSQPIPIENSDLNKVPLIAHDQIVNWLNWHSTQKLDDVSCPINIIEWLYTDMSISKVAFMIDILDDAMASEYLVGHRVLIEPDFSPVPTDDVCAYVEGKGIVFRRYKELNARGDFELQPLNGLYATYKSTDVEIKVLGVMMEHRIYRRTR